MTIMTTSLTITGTITAGIATETAAASRLKT
jgi:hypothetical protein